MNFKKPFVRHLIIFSFAAILSLFLSISVNAEETVSKDELIYLTVKKQSNAGWLRRRKKELLDQGHSLKEIMEITTKEAEARSSGKSKGIAEKAGDYFQSKGFGNWQGAKTLASPILEKVSHIPVNSQETELNKLFQVEALKVLEGIEDYKKTDKEVLSIVSEKWVQWIFAPSSEQASMLVKMVAEVEKDIERIRRERAEREKLKLKFAAVKNKTEANLRGKNLKGSDYDYVFEIEFDILLKIDSLTGELQNKKYQELHVREAEVFIREYNLGDKTLAVQWSNFFFSGRQGRVSLYKKIVRDIFEQGLKGLEAKWASKLKANGMEGRQLAKMLGLEMSIQRQVLQQPTGKRDGENYILHMLEADQILRESDILDIYVKGKNHEYFFKEISSTWSEWFHFNELERNVRLKGMRDKVEFQTVVNRMMDQIEKANKDKALTATIQSLDKDITGLIAKYYDYETKAFKDFYKKLPAVFDSEIMKAKSKSQTKLAKELIQWKEDFLMSGICPVTSVDKINQVQFDYKEKLTRKYHEFFPKYEYKIDKVKKVFAARVKKEAKKNIDLADKINKIYKDFIVAENDYTEMGNKFVATVTVHHSAARGNLCEVMVDGKLMPLKGELVQNALEGVAHYELKANVTLRMGQYICVKTPSITGGEPAFACTIVLNDRYGIASDAKQWQTFICAKKTWFKTASHKSFKQAKVSGGSGVSSGSLTTNTMSKFSKDGLTANPLQMSCHPGRFEGYLRTRVVPEYFVERDSFSRN